VAFHLYALVGREATLRSAAEGRTHARVVPLRFGLALIPVSQELSDELEAGAPATPPPYLEFVHLSNPIAAWGKAASENGIVAYVEAEDDGVIGWEAMIVWKGGQRMMGPDHKEARGPINEALRELGVVATVGDEFDGGGGARGKESLADA
jgi:hypothetical protein